MLNTGNLFFFLTLLLAGLLMTACSNSPQSAQKKIDKIAQDMKAELPKILDRDTKLVKVYTAELELVSEYELVNYDPTGTENQKIKNKVELYLKMQVCPEIKEELLGMGISSRYIYKGNDGQVLVNRLISPGDC